MLEEAEDRAARAAVEGWPVGTNTKVVLRAGELFIGDFPVAFHLPVAKQPARKPLVIIESPYSGPLDNIWYAQACLLDSLRRGEAPIASHLLHTQVLDDMQPDERELGIEAGLAWYRVAEKCVVYEDLGISNGMRAGIARAYDHGVPVEFRRLEAWRATA
ncbi:hypothetical protein NJB95_07670 [Brucella intermedia]|uniref:DUF7768 domain-containing protein n=1 Tax=Brucella intermedia TaxID=94625 RepID=UPI00209AD9E5|nr:hypothetical protein [Brucella intermedia]MCO7736489.1 hypothetical protein [Brucella intermedia]WLF99163.1 hypothetical protein Q5698_15735 [Brucella intermedia]